MALTSYCDHSGHIPSSQILTVAPQVAVNIDSRPCAVVVRNACKSYGKSDVINGLNMTIRQGTIYSFLGSSGCGKTTTLECIVGLRKFTSGKVLLFGKEPGTKDSGVPGKSVGYMPQEYSLYNQLSIAETLMYFGTMNGMNKVEIYESLAFFTKLFQLPKYNNSIASLSGGEKRRVSLIVAVMHAPPLVILDEPTVGMDPLLCENVLKYLNEITRTKGATVVTTTHYTETARQSDTIAVMRNGKLIVENSPSKLLQKYEEASLEAVILKLCKTQCDIESNDLASVEDANDDVMSTAIISAERNHTHFRRSLKESLTRTRALVKRNMFICRRTLTLIYLTIVFPAMSLAVNYYCFDEFKYVNLGVVNEELNYSSCDQFGRSWNHTCSIHQWSCRYLEQLNQPNFILTDYGSVEEAEKQVRLGKIWGFIVFPGNFSDELFLRAMSGGEKGVEVSLNGSSIFVHLDKSNTPLALFTEFALLTGFANFLKEIFQDCELDSKRIEYSLNFKEPILGKDIPYMNYAIPPFIILQMFFISLASTGLQHVSDKRQGTTQRGIVAGTQLWEIFLSHSITELGISVLRMLVCYGTVSLLLGMTVLGSRLLEAILCLLMGCVGVELGFILGVFCADEVQFCILVMGMYFPSYLLSGTNWPLEGMPGFLRKIAYFLPCTLPSEAIRSMVNRGWGMEVEHVWIGFVIAVCYLLVFSLGVVVFSRKFKP